MATTANYGWTTPDDTDLVKDGASAIRSLGTAIDTTVKSVSDASGLVHIETINPSSASAISFSNGVLSATYDRYLIVGNFQQNTSTGDFQMRGRTSGTSNSGANYVDQFLSAANTSITATRATGQTSWEVLAAVPTGFAAIQMYLYNFFPNDTQKSFISKGIRATSSTSLTSIDYGGGWTGSAVSFDSVEFLTGGGSITGQFSLYGFKD